MRLVESAVLERVGGITLADDVASAVRDVDLVFETVFERIDVKQVVLQAIEGAARADALIASNSPATSYSYPLTPPSPPCDNRGNDRRS